MGQRKGQKRVQGPSLVQERSRFVAVLRHHWGRSDQDSREILWEESFLQTFDGLLVSVTFSHSHGNT